MKRFFKKWAWALLPLLFALLVVLISPVGLNCDWLINSILVMTVCGLAATMFLMGIGGLFVLILIRESTRKPLLLIASSLGLAATIPLDHWLQHRDENLAKEYSGVIDPLLEEYSRQLGQYPKSLSELPAKPPTPKLFQYSSDGTNYQMRVSDPGSLIVWLRSDKNPIWQSRPES